MTYNSGFDNFITTDTIYNSDSIKIEVVYEKLINSNWQTVTEMESHGTYRVKFANKWSLKSGYTNDYVITALNHTEFVISKLQVEIGIVNPNSYFESYYTSKEHVYDGSYTIHSHNSPTELKTLPDKATLSIGYYELIRNGEEVSKGTEISAGKFVGEYYCTSKELNFADSSVSENYDITFVENDYSVLKIIQSEIYISMKEIENQNKSKIYDGTRLTDVSSSTMANVNLRSSQISVKATDFLHTISADMRYYDTPLGSIL